MFSAFVIVYLFLGGFGSGLLLISAFSSLVFHCALDRNEIEVAAFDEWRNDVPYCAYRMLGIPRFCELYCRPHADSNRHA